VSSSLQRRLLRQERLGTLPKLGRRIRYTCLDVSSEVCTPCSFEKVFVLPVGNDLLKRSRQRNLV